MVEPKFIASPPKGGGKKWEGDAIPLGRAPASQGRHLTGFASLGASHASPLQAAHAKK
jgi:hypothetical protein